VLKVVRSDLESREVLARFEAERPALSRVGHPGIARIVDAGVSTDGSPFFVEEWVPGVPITEHCDRECLTIHQRLELFAQVCEAIQHAHEAGALHGEIRPSNVVVSNEDDGPRPRVLDLGVSRAVGPRLRVEAWDAARGILSGAPCHVAPEQARRDLPLEGNARTDVYALGALLYELITSAPLLDVRRTRGASWEETAQVIREDEPLRPSARVRSLGEPAASEIAARRGTDSLQLIRQLRGDLDAVTMKALEKDPARRYASADELGLDVRRHLAGEPVAARAQGLVGRVIRWTQRS